MLSLMIITTLCTCLAFDSPATIAAAARKNPGIVAFPQTTRARTTHWLPPDTIAFNRRVVATTPAKISLLTLFESQRENKNEENYSYDFFGKTKISKRRRLKSAARKIVRSLKDKSKFSDIDTNGDGLLSEIELENYTTSKKGQRKTALAKHDEEELLFLLRNLKDSNGDHFIDKSEFDQSVRNFAASSLGRASHGTAKRHLEKTTTSDHGPHVVSSINSTTAELLTGMPKQFSLVDLDGDGLISEEEYSKASLSSSSSSSLNDDNDDDAEEDYTNSLDRQDMRLSGFDPYILVSVLTAAQSFDVINGYHQEWNVLGSKSSLMALTTQDWLMSAILVTAGASTVMGIYAAVVFSLTVLYGRTALGMKVDEEYDNFLENTGLQRYRAFRAFSGSLGLFCLLVIFELFKKSAGVFRLPIVVASVAILYFGKQEYDTIIEAAGPIFVSNDDGDDGDDDR